MSKYGALFTPIDLGIGTLSVAVKDCIDIAGMPTIGGSAALADAPPAETDAAVVLALLEGNCRLIGKANMHELAYGVTGVNLWTGTPVNPLFPDHVPGGSSSGSAVAVAEGLVDFAIGTDTGGSIRTPAACCGVFGLKPTFGRVNREGAWPRVSTLDCIGPFARSVAMIEKAMTIISGDFAPLDVREPRIAVVRPDGVDTEVQEVFEACVARIDESADEVGLPELDAAYAANITLIAAETYAAFGHLVGSGKLGADVEARLAAAASVDAAKITEAEGVRTQFRSEVNAALEERDVLVLPTMPCFPLRVDRPIQAAEALRMTALVRPFNLSGHPALTIPVMAPSGLPIGIQIVGRMGDDETVCAVGRLIESRISTIQCFAGEDEYQ